MILQDYAWNLLDELYLKSHSKVMRLIRDKMSLFNAEFPKIPAIQAAVGQSYQHLDDAGVKT